VAVPPRATLDAWFEVAPAIGAVYGVASAEDRTQALRVIEENEPMKAIGGLGPPCESPLANDDRRQIVICPQDCADGPGEPCGY